MHYFCHYHYYTVYIGLKDKKCLERGLRHYLKLHGIHQRITYTAAQVKTTVMRILKKCPNEIESSTLPQQPNKPETPVPKTPVVGGTDGGDAPDDNTDPGSIDDSTIGPNDGSTTGGSTGGNSGGSDEPDNTNVLQQGNGTDTSGNGASQQGHEASGTDTDTGATSDKSDPPIGNGDSPQNQSDTPAPAPLLEVPIIEPAPTPTCPAVEPPIVDATLPPVVPTTSPPSIAPHPHATTSVAVEVVESGSSSSSGSGSAVDPKPEQPAVVPPSVVTPVVTVTPVTELNQSTDTSVIDTTSTTINTDAEQQRVDSHNTLAVDTVAVVDSSHNDSTATAERRESDTPLNIETPSVNGDSPGLPTEPTATPSPQSSSSIQQQLPDTLDAVVDSSGSGSSGSGSSGSSAIDTVPVQPATAVVTEAKPAPTVTIVPGPELGVDTRSAVGVNAEQQPESNPTTTAVSETVDSVAPSSISDTPAPAPLFEVPATEPIPPTTSSTVKPPVDDTTVPPVDAPTPTPSIVPGPHATTPVAVEVDVSGSSSSGSGSAVDTETEQPAVAPTLAVTPVVTVTPVTELNQSTDTDVTGTTSTAASTDAEQQRVDGHNALAVDTNAVVDSSHNDSTTNAQQKQSDAPLDGDTPSVHGDSPGLPTEPTATPSPQSSSSIQQQLPDILDAVVDSSGSGSSGSGSSGSSAIDTVPVQPATAVVTEAQPAPTVTIVPGPELGVDTRSAVGVNAEQQPESNFTATAVGEPIVPVAPNATSDPSTASEQGVSDSASSKHDQDTSATVNGSNGDREPGHIRSDETLNKDDHSTSDAPQDITLPSSPPLTTVEVAVETTTEQPFEQLVEPPQAQVSVEEEGKSSGGDSTIVDGQSIAVADATPALTPTLELELEQSSSNDVSDATRAATSTDTAQQLVDAHDATAVDTTVDDNDNTPVAVALSSNPSVEAPIDISVQLPTPTTDETAGAIDVDRHALDDATATTTPTVFAVDEHVDEVIAAVAKPSATPQALVNTHASVSKPQYATKLKVEQWDQQVAPSDVTLFATSTPPPTAFQLPQAGPSQEPLKILYPAPTTQQYKTASPHTKAAYLNKVTQKNFQNIYAKCVY
jgi:hypothetical protein